MEIMILCWDYFNHFEVPLQRISSRDDLFLCIHRRFSAPTKGVRLLTKGGVRPVRVKDGSVGSVLSEECRPVTLGAAGHRRPLFRSPNCFPRSSKAVARLVKQLAACHLSTHAVSTPARDRKKIMRNSCRPTHFLILEMLPEKAINGPIHFRDFFL